MRISDWSSDVCSSDLQRHPSPALPCLRRGGSKPKTLVENMMPNTPANDRFLRALRREPVDRTPVWLMRQAGRYLPEYPATRARAGSFLAFATNPEIDCGVTLQPTALFDLDAPVLFSSTEERLVGQKGVRT